MFSVCVLFYNKNVFKIKINDTQDKNFSGENPYANRKTYLLSLKLLPKSQNNIQDCLEQIGL